jgi:hypothetical protein
MYLTVLAVFITAFSAVTGGIGVYSDGTIYIRNSSYFTIAIVLVFFDFIYEAGKFILKMKILPDKSKETNTTETESAIE